MKKALVVGATGPVGKAFSAKLRKEGYYVVGTGRIGRTMEAEQEILVKDLSEQSCQKIIQEAGNCELVVWVAGNCYKDDKEDKIIRQTINQVNWVAPCYLADKMKEIQNFIYISDAIVFSNTIRLRSYALSKQLAEKALKEILKNRLTIVNPSTIAGTRFMQKAGLVPDTKTVEMILKIVHTLAGTWKPEKLAEYVIDNMGEERILPGWVSRCLYKLKNTNPKLLHKIADFL